MPVVYVNQVGGNDSLIFDGSSVAIMPDGRIAAQAKSFEEDLVFFDTRHRRRAISTCQPTNELEVAYRGLGDAALATTSANVVFSKVVVGLSGGVDSALVAAIATDALGA